MPPRVVERGAWQEVEGEVTGGVCGNLSTWGSDLKAGWVARMYSHALSTPEQGWLE